MNDPTAASDTGRSNGDGRRDFYATVWVYQHPKLRAALWLYCDLVRECGTRGWAWLDQQAIAERCGTTVRAVQRAQKTLVDHKAIDVAGRVIDSGTGWPLYRFAGDGGPERWVEWPSAAEARCRCIVPRHGGVATHASLPLATDASSPVATDASHDPSTSIPTTSIPAKNATGELSARSRALISQLARRGLRRYTGEVWDKLRGQMTDFANEQWTYPDRIESMFAGFEVVADGWQRNEGGWLVENIAGATGVAIERGRGFARSPSFFTALISRCLADRQDEGSWSIDIHDEIVDELGRVFQWTSRPTFDDVTADGTMYADGPF